MNNSTLTDAAWLLKSQTLQTKDNPLVAKNWQNLVYVAFALIVGILAIVGIFSRKLEYVAVMALALSMIIIVSFLVIEM